MAKSQGRHVLGPNELAYKRASLAVLKQSAVTGIEGLTVLEEWPNLSSSFVRFETEQALTDFLARPQVVRVHREWVVEPLTTESLPLIGQPGVVAGGLGGAGKVIAIFDTGINANKPVFGNCTSTDPPEPAGCRVVATIDPAGDNDPGDPAGHGTLVSAIVATVAPGADLVVADVLDINESGENLTAVGTALNWVIQLDLDEKDIVALNMSFGFRPEDPENPENPPMFHTEPCSGAPLEMMFNDALMAGIQPIAASGNAAHTSTTPPHFVDGTSGAGWR
jgi:subtilisin family serine protease